VLHTWQDGLDYLYGLANWETRPPGTQPSFELDRVRSLLAMLGDPHQAWPAVHVGGTNGKGSTAAMIASVLQQSGYRVGLYTSPHLHTVRERVQVDGALISEREVLRWLREHRTRLDGSVGLTTFEALTALAFSTFARRRVDVAVVEVGLGGTLDATNVVQPCVSVLTPIGLDHTEVLGRSVAVIAADKAGILRPGVPAVLAPQPAEAEAVLTARARALGVPLVRVGDDVLVGPARQLPAAQRMEVAWPRRGARHAVTTGLLGPCQRVNAAVALATCCLLADLGWAVSGRAVARGMRRAHWPGRFEVLGRSPLVVVDGAHNPPAADALLATMDERLGTARRHLVLGASVDKDVEGLLAGLLPGACTAILTRSEHPRAMAVARLCELAARQVSSGVSGAGATGGGPSGVRILAEATVADALERALDLARPEDAVVVTGSLFVVAEAREAWARRGGMAMPPRDPPPVGLPPPGTVPPAGRSRGGP